MEVKVTLFVRIEPDSRIDESSLTSADRLRLRASAIDAISNAIEHAENNGFNHPLAGTATVEVYDIEGE